MEGIPQTVCYFCSSAGHYVSKCPTLSDPLKEGFYSGGSSGGSHSHDEEDE
jgi:hypothetical protein